MKALVKKHAEPGIWMEDIAEPNVGPNDVLIKVRRTAICGTDIHIYRWDDWARQTIPVPMAVGHEFSGVIVACGSEVYGFAEGDRVSAEGHVTCGVCPSAVIMSTDCPFFSRVQSGTRSPSTLAPTQALPIRVWMA